MSITNCKKGRCRLKKNTKVSIVMKLAPGLLIFFPSSISIRLKSFEYCVKEICRANQFNIQPNSSKLIHCAFQIDFRHILDHDVKKLTTNVHAVIVGLPLPFIGVDQTSACDNIYLEDGTTKTQCPLKAGQKYVYKNTIDVLPVYPTLSALDVHWALTENNNRELVCFEIPAKITN